MNKRQMIKEIAKSVQSDDLSLYRKKYSKVSDLKHMKERYAGCVSPISYLSRNYDSDVMVVGQDWANYDSVKNRNITNNPMIGYNPVSKTNLEFDKRFAQIGRKREDLYMTNAFVHLKHTATIDGSVSAPDMRRSIEKFTLREIETIQPKVVLVFGSNASAQMKKLVGDEHAGAKIVYMSHPSARITNARKDAEWKKVKKML